MSARDSLRFRRAEIEDADALARVLREADRREIQAAVGRGAAETLREGVANSDPCWAAAGSGGALLALFGVVPDAGKPRSGMIWLLGSEDLARQRFAVARASRACVARIEDQYDKLWNYVDARNEAHIRWLKWCGFRFVRLEDHWGVEGRAFWRIERGAIGCLLP